MTKLTTASRIGDPDTFYAELIELHRGLSDEQARLLDARLILLLANEIGDLDVLRQAMAAAREGI
jgi:Protein of unknown function (DUF2783)